MVPRVGQKIGPYEILGRLGSGGMGLVFSAWDTRLHRDVAIKLLKDEFLNPTMRSRFLGEARAASRLNHPNICTIFDIGEEQDCPYMVMELLKGETLRGRMQQGEMPIATILQVATQVADALSVAHEQGIVHRDVKPANVVLVDKPNGSFQTKVLDFGLAKVDMGELDSRSGLTTTGMTVGTVSYMSPEQARGELLDGRSDLFSLGVLMYEMSTRRLPFDGATSALVFVQLLNHPPESLRTLNAGIPRSLEQVVNTCLQKKRDDRYQTGQELVAALHKAALTLESSEKSTSWLSKFATGLRREGVVTVPPLLPQGDTPETPAGVPSPLQMTSEEAFLRPFKPQRHPSSSSQHYKPVNAPYTASGSEAIGPSMDDTSPPQPLTEVDSMPVAQDIGQTSSRSVSNANVRGLEWLEDPVEAPPHDDLILPESESSSSTRGWRILIGLFIAAAIVMISILVIVSKKKELVTRVAPTVALSAIANHTADSSIPSLVSGGLNLALQQSSFVGLRNPSATGMQLVSEIPARGSAQFTTLQQAAKSSGAAVFALGEVHMEGSTYFLSLHLYDTEKGITIGDCASTAVSRERLVGAVDGLATGLRSALGETSTSIASASLPLSRVASSNPEALSAYDQGMQLEVQDRVVEAMQAFERAIAIEPQFSRAYLRLARIYWRQHAELGASNAANQAKAYANGDAETSLLASGMQSIFASGDLNAAASILSELTQKYSSHVDGFVLLAETQRLQGDFVSAQATSRHALRLSPTDQFAVREQQIDLLALDHVDAALQLASLNSEKSPSGIELLAAFVRDGSFSRPNTAVVQSRTDFDTQMHVAALLDATGQFDDGLSEWKSIAQRVSLVPSLSSAAAYALSQAALDRALAGDCSSAIGLVRDASAYGVGLEATFTMGLASGLCGNLGDLHLRVANLTVTYPQSTRAKGSYTSDLNALVQWKAGALADAITTLQSASQFDQTSFNQYLLGQVYLAQRQTQPATVAFQTSLRRPGALALMNAEALPMTHLALARAFVANGDGANAAQAYRQVATMLKSADPANPILAEAQLALSH